MRDNWTKSTRLRATQDFRNRLAKGGHIITAQVDIEAVCQDFTTAGNRQAILAAIDRALPMLAVDGLVPGRQLVMEAVAAFMGVPNWDRLCALVPRGAKTSVALPTFTETTPLRCCFEATGCHLAVDGFARDILRRFGATSALGVLRLDGRDDYSVVCETTMNADDVLEATQSLSRRHSMTVVSLMAARGDAHTLEHEIVACRGALALDTHDQGASVSFGSVAEVRDQVMHRLGNMKEEPGRPWRVHLHGRMLHEYRDMDEDAAYDLALEEVEADIGAQDWQPAFANPVGEWHEELDIEVEVSERAGEPHARRYVGFMATASTYVMATCESDAMYSALRVLSEAALGETNAPLPGGMAP